MRPTAFLFAFGALAVACSSSGQAAQTECDAPELLRGSIQYNERVCASIAAMQGGDYRRAVENLESALDQRLSDYPNFRPYSRLALAYSRLGDGEAAERALERARLTLSVYLGFLACRVEEGRFTLRTAAGARVESPQVTEVAALMCGDAYSYIYEQTDLGTLKQDLPLLELYYETQRSVR